MRVLALISILSLGACSSLHVARDLRENCIGANGSCTTDLARHATLDTLRANGASIVVECETVFVPLDDAYRERCRKDLEELIAVLSERGADSFSPITQSDIVLEDFRGCIDGSDNVYDFFGVKATLPLQWHAEPPPN